MSDDTPKTALPDEAAPGAAQAPDVRAAVPPPAGASLDLAGIESRAGEARDRFEQLLRGRRNSRIVRYIVLLLFLGVFFGWIFVTYSTVSAFDMNEFEREMQARSDRIWPRISEMLFSVATEVRPAYAMAIARELDKAGPVIADRIDTEAKILEGNVQQALQQRLDASFKRVAAEQRNELKKAFPELANDPKALDRMMATVEEGLRTWVSKELTTTLHEHVDALLDIKASLAAFRPDDPHAKVDAEEVLGVWLELVYERMGGDEELEVTPATSPAAAPPAKRAPAKQGASR